MPETVEETAKATDGPSCNRDRQVKDNRNKSHDKKANDRKKFSRVKVSEELLLRLRSDNGEEDAEREAAGHYSPYSNSSSFPPDGDKDDQRPLAGNGEQHALVAPSDKIYRSSTLDSIGFDHEKGEDSPVEVSMEWDFGGTVDSEIPDGGDCLSSSFLLSSLSSPSSSSSSPTSVSLDINVPVDSAFGEGESTSSSSSSSASSTDSGTGVSPDVTSEAGAIQAITQSFSWLEHELFAKEEESDLNRDSNFENEHNMNAIEYVSENERVKNRRESSHYSLDELGIETPVDNAQEFIDECFGWVIDNDSSDGPSDDSEKSGSGSDIHIVCCDSDEHGVESDDSGDDDGDNDNSNDAGVDDNNLNGNYDYVDDSQNPSEMHEKRSCSYAVKGVDNYDILESREDFNSVTDIDGGNQEIITDSIDNKTFNREYDLNDDASRCTYLQQNSEDFQLQEREVRIDKLEKSVTGNEWTQEKDYNQGAINKRNELETDGKDTANVFDLMSRIRTAILSEDVTGDLNLDDDDDDSRHITKTCLIASVGEHEVWDSSVSESDEVSEAETCILRHAGIYNSITLDSQEDEIGTVLDDLPSDNSFDGGGVDCDDASASDDNVEPERSLSSSTSYVFDCDDLGEDAVFKVNSGSRLELNTKVNKRRAKKEPDLPSVHSLPTLNKQIKESLSGENSSVNICESIPCIESSNSQPSKTRIESSCGNCNKQGEGKGSKAHSSGTCLGCLVEMDKIKNKSAFSREKMNHSFKYRLEYSNNSKRKKTKRLLKDEQEKSDDDDNEENEDRSIARIDKVRKTRLDRENLRWYKVEKRRLIDERNPIIDQFEDRKWPDKENNEPWGDDDGDGSSREYNESEGPNDLEDLRWRKIKERLQTGSSRRRRMRRVIRSSDVSFHAGNSDVSLTGDTNDISSLDTETTTKVEEYKGNTEDVKADHLRTLYRNKFKANCHLNKEFEDSLADMNMLSTVHNMNNFSANKYHNSNLFLSKDYQLQQRCNNVEQASCHEESKCCQYQKLQNTAQEKEARSSYATRDYRRNYPSSATGRDIQIPSNGKWNTSVDDCGYNSDFEGDVDSDSDEEDSEGEDDNENDVDLAGKTIDSLKFVSLYRDKHDGKEDHPVSKHTIDKMNKRKRERTVVMIRPLNDVVEAEAISDCNKSHLENSCNLWSLPNSPSNYPPPPSSPAKPLCASPPINPIHSYTHMNSSNTGSPIPIFSNYDIYNHSQYGPSLPVSPYHNDELLDKHYNTAQFDAANFYNDGLIPNHNSTCSTLVYPDDRSLTETATHSQRAYPYHSVFESDSSSPSRDSTVPTSLRLYAPAPIHSSSRGFTPQNNPFITHPSYSGSFTHYNDPQFRSNDNPSVDSKSMSRRNSHVRESECYRNGSTNSDATYNDVVWKDTTHEMNCGYSKDSNNRCKTQVSHQSSSLESKMSYGASRSVTPREAERALDDGLLESNKLKRSLVGEEGSEVACRELHLESHTQQSVPTSLTNSFRKPSRGVMEVTDTRLVVSTSFAGNNSDSKHRLQHCDGECDNEGNGKNGSDYNIVRDQPLENNYNAWMTTAGSNCWPFDLSRVPQQNDYDMRRSIIRYNACHQDKRNNDHEQGKCPEKITNYPPSPHHLGVTSACKIDSREEWQKCQCCKEDRLNWTDLRDCSECISAEYTTSRSGQCSCIHKNYANPVPPYYDRISKAKFWKAVKYNNDQSHSQSKHKQCSERAKERQEDKENDADIYDMKNDYQNKSGKIKSTSQKWLRSIPASCLSHTLCAQYPLYKKIQSALCRTDNIIASSLNKMKPQAPTQGQPKSLFNNELSVHTPKEPICTQPRSFLKETQISSEESSSEDSSLKETEINDFDSRYRREVESPEDFLYFRSLRREPPDGTASPDEPLEKKSGSIKATNHNFREDYNKLYLRDSVLEYNDTTDKQQHLSDLLISRSPLQEVWDPGKGSNIDTQYPTDLQSEVQTESLNAVIEPQHHEIRWDCGSPTERELHQDRNTKAKIDGEGMEEAEANENNDLPKGRTSNIDLLSTSSENEETHSPNREAEIELPCKSLESQEPRPPPTTEAFKPTRNIIPEPTTHQSSIFLAVDPHSPSNQQHSLIDLMKLGHYEGYVTMPMIFTPVQVPPTNGANGSVPSQPESSPEVLSSDNLNSAESDVVNHSTQVRVSLRKYCKRKKDGSRQLVIKFTLCLECAGCKEELVEGQALIALDQQWHIWCFKCAACNTVLHGEYMGKDGLPYCEKDYQAQFGVKCAYCDRFISGKVLQAGDNHHFHPTCARCSKCGDPFGDGEEMYLQGTAIWHPRCGPGPTENGTVLNGSISNGHHVNGEQKTERERDFDGMSSTASETQFIETVESSGRWRRFSRSRTPSLNGSFRSYSPYNSLNRKFSGPYRTCSPGLILREYKSSQSPVDITRIYTYSYLAAEPSQGYLKRPLDPYDRPPPKSPHFHRPPSESRKLSLPKTNSRLGMRVLVDQMQTETPRPKSPHMNNEEPILLSHYPGARKPPTGGISRIERDDFPAPPYPYTDPDVSERRRRWSGSTKAVSIDETDEATELEDDDTLVEDPKLKKEEVELSKIATGIGKVFLQQVKEREKIRAWKASHLDPRNASRSPAADREPPNKLRFGTSLNASPSRMTDHNRPWGPEDDEFDRGSSYRCSTGRSSATIPSYNVVSSLRQPPKPGYGFSPRNTFYRQGLGSYSALHGDYSFSGLGEKTQSTEFSSARSDVSAGSLTDADRSALNAELCASATYSSGLRGYSSYSPHLRRSLPNMHHMSSEPPKIYPAHLLLVSNYRLPNDVDRCHLERHLSDTDFEMVFHMTRMDFYRLPEWRRNDLKRRAKFF